MAGQYYEGVGRRKNSVARVRVSAGTGVFTVNDKQVAEYFTRFGDVEAILGPFVAINQDQSGYDISVHVNGGGVTGQAGAIRHGISRALLQYDSENLRGKLKKAGFLTRDPRMKERKKYGLKAARRASQFSKR